MIVSLIPRLFFKDVISVPEMFWDDQAAVFHCVKQHCLYNIAIFNLFRHTHRMCTPVTAVTQYICGYNYGN
jgi:hypothetical protein